MKTTHKQPGTEQRDAEPDPATIRKQPFYLRYMVLCKEYQEKIRADAQRAELLKADKIWHNGLKRNLKEEDRLRSMIQRFDQGVRLNDVDLRFLLQYYGIMIRMCEMSGQCYYLARQDASGKHQRLVDMARERGWTQNLISMYGIMVESIFERIA